MRSGSGSGRRVPKLFFLWVAALGLLTPNQTPLLGQAIRGVIIDDTNLTPVAGAMVYLVRDGKTEVGTETNDEGHFFLPSLSHGEYRLEVRRLGYQTTLSQAVVVERGDTVAVEFRVRPDAILLAPLTVVGRSRMGRDAFDRRRSGAERGFFLTPAMIDSISPNHPAEVLKGLAKVDVRWGWGRTSTGSSGPIPTVRTVLGRGCVLYMVDFMQVNPPPWASGDWSSYLLGGLTGEDIVAVEVYRSILEVPKELLRYTDRARTVMNMNSGGTSTKRDVNCGLVVFWTGQGW